MNRIILLVMGLALVGCHADDEVKQGVQGEYCVDSDADCRQGYVCDRGYCRLLSIDGTDCRAMCARIASCGVVDESCVDDCQATVAGDCGGSLPCPWSDNAVDQFGNCGAAGAAAVLSQHQQQFQKLLFHLHSILYEFPDLLPEATRFELPRLRECLDIHRPLLLLTR